jgi:predicted RNA-binding Zn-ribbon protein involved in translation (DUF1610 family)
VSKPNIILFDIETIPDQEKALEVWCQLSNYYGQTMKATITTIICVGWKKLGDKKTHCVSAWDFPNWEKNINDDKEVCKKIHEILKDADAVVTHNGRRFDWKHLQTRFLVNGLPPLPNIPHIDTCLIARKNLLSFNNRLGYLGKWLAGDTKLENGGWELWVKVSKRIKYAQKLMVKYCKQDVDLLEKVFEKLRPFIKNLPNQNIDRDQKLVNEDTFVCPTCGSGDLVRNGWAYTKTTKYQRTFCKSCKSYSRLNAKDKKPRAN